MSIQILRHRADAGIRYYIDATSKQMERDAKAVKGEWEVVGPIRRRMAAAFAHRGYEMLNRRSGCVRGVQLKIGDTWKFIEDVQRELYPHKTVAQMLEMGIWYR